MSIIAKSEKTEFPRLVAIETTNRCNASCQFCPNSRLNRSSCTMSDALFEKIIEECREFPLKAIEPFLNGEPFMDPKILDRMEYIRQRLPKTKLRLYTNGNLMTPAKIDRMVDLGIDHLFVSLNYLNANAYRRHMGLNLEKTLSNLAYLTDPKRRHRVARNISFRMVRTNEHTLFMQDQFLEYCDERDVKSFIVGQFNYKGDIESTLPIPGYPCEHISRLDILSSGWSTLCCMDQEGMYGWGNLNENSVLDVFNSAAAQHTRRMHREGRRKQMTPCKSCNLFWPEFTNCGFKNKVKFLVEAFTYFIFNQPNGRRSPSSDQARDG